MHLHKGQTCYISDDSAALWLHDYNVRVNSPVTILRTPNSHDKKVLVCIDEIDGDRNVNTYVRKSLVHPYESLAELRQ